MDRSPSSMTPDPRVTSRSLTATELAITGLLAVVVVLVGED